MLCPHVMLDVKEPQLWMISIIVSVSPRWIESYDKAVMKLLIPEKDSFLQLDDNQCKGQ